MPVRLTAQHSKQDPNIDLCWRTADAEEGRYVGNLAPMPGVFPDYKAPIVRNGADGP